METSITDELREYAEKAVKRSDYMGGLTFDLRRIADRIDATMEDYIELPKDARGQTIRIDEKLRYGANIMCTVEAVNERAFVAWNPEDRCYVLYPAENFTHVQSDSWERIIEDAGELGYDWFSTPMGDEAHAEKIGRLVERCKRLAREGA